MRIVSVCRHQDIYCGENQVPELNFCDIQDVDVPEVFDMADEKIVLRRTLCKYVSAETATELLTHLNERIGAYSLIANANEKGTIDRYTLIMFFELDLSSTVISDFTLHLADVFLM